MGSRGPTRRDSKTTAVRETITGQPRRLQQNSARPGLAPFNYRANEQQSSGDNSEGDGSDSGSDFDSSESDCHLSPAVRAGSRSRDLPHRGAPTPPKGFPAPAKVGVRVGRPTPPARSSRGIQLSTHPSHSTGTESVSSLSAESDQGSSHPDEEAYAEDNLFAGDLENSDSVGVQLHESPIKKEVRYVADRLQADPVTVIEAMERRQQLRNELDGFEQDKEKVKLPRESSLGARRQN